MKKVVCFYVFLLITSICVSQNAPIDFESSGQGANWTWTTFENDTNPLLEIVANPDPSGINTSATVARFTALETGAPFAGVESMRGEDIGTFTLSSDNAIVRIMVYKTVISNVGIKYSTNEGASTGEMLISNTSINQWEELTFDFTSVINEPSSTDINQIVVFPDFQDRMSDNVIYFDNISYTEQTNDNPVVLPVDFENETLTYDFLGFEGADSALEANPDPSDENPSATVMRSVKTEGAQFFAGTLLDIDEPIDFSESEIISINSYSPKSNIPVRLALENQTTGNQIFVDVNTTIADKWETLSFDFTGIIDPNIDYNRVVVFFEFIVDLPGDGSTYFYDDIQVGTPLSISDQNIDAIHSYPNPVDQVWTIQANEQIKQISMYNLLGQKVVDTFPNLLEYILDVSQLKSGTYLVTIRTNTRNETLKIVKI